MAKKNELMQEILLVMMKNNIKDVSETIDCLTSKKEEILNFLRERDNLLNFSSNVVSNKEKRDNENIEELLLGVDEEKGLLIREIYSSILKKKYNLTVLRQKVLDLSDKELENDNLNFMQKKEIINLICKLLKEKDVETVRKCRDEFNNPLSMSAGRNNLKEWSQLIIDADNKNSSGSII